MRGPIYRAGFVCSRPHAINPALLQSSAPRVFNLLLQVGSDPYSPEFSQEFGIGGSPSVAACVVSSVRAFNQSAGTTLGQAAMQQKRTCF